MLEITGFLSEGNILILALNELERSEVTAKQLHLVVVVSVRHCIP